jgi:sulfide:quinone oxidoreductase
MTPPRTDVMVADMAPTSSSSVFTGDPMTGRQAHQGHDHRTQRPGGGAARRVVIAGAGVGALEALLALRALMPRGLAIDVLAPGESFLYRPVSIAASLLATEAAAFDLDALLREQAVRRHVDALERVDTAKRTVRTRSGATLAYDELIVATGPRLRSALRGALAMRGRADMPAARATVAELAHGRLGSLACVLPPHSRAWPIPIYELALATAARAPRAAVSIVTAEPRPLGVLGATAGDAVGALLASRGVTVHAGAPAPVYEDGVLALGDGRSLEADRVIALPRLDGPAIPGLPADEDGFLPIDAHGRVEGVDGVYAAGDGTSFPIKQGALAAAQADAIARTIAARAGAPVEPVPFRPAARGLLLLGPDPLYVRVSPGERPHSMPSTARHGDGVWPEGALWWPFSRSAGRLLAPLLATASAASAGRARRFEAGSAEAASLWLTLADHDAQSGEPALAIDALDHARALTGSLPARYAAKREAWRALAGPHAATAAAQ